MNVIENCRRTAKKQQYVTQNIEGAFSGENGKSAVDEDKKVSTEIDLISYQGMVKAGKSMVKVVKPEDQ